MAAIPKTRADADTAPPSRFQSRFAICQANQQSENKGELWLFYGDSRPRLGREGPLMSVGSMVRPRPPSARFGTPAQFSEGPAQISFDFELTVVGLELGRRSENAGPKRVAPLVAEPCTHDQRKPAGGVLGSCRLVLEAQRNIRFELIEFVGCLTAQLEQTEPHDVRKWRDTAQNRIFGSFPGIGVAGETGKLERVQIPEAVDVSGPRDPIAAPRATRTRRDRCYIVP